MLGNLLVGLLAGISAVNVGVALLLLLWEGGLQRPISIVTVPALRGGLAIGIVICGLYTLISWASGTGDWFRLGMRNGVLLTLVTYVAAYYLTQRQLRRNKRSRASVSCYMPADMPLSTDGGIRVRPASAQQIADFRRRKSGTASQLAKRPANIRPYDPRRNG